MTVRRSLAWVFSGQFTNLVVSFLGSVVIARLLSPRELGVYAVAVATVGMLAIVSTLGINHYVVREQDVTADKVASAFTINALINIGLSGIVFALSFVGASSLGDPAVGRVLRLLALPPLIGIFEFRPSVLQQRDMQFKPLAVIGTTSNLLSVSLTALFAAQGCSSMSMPYATIIAALFRVVAFYRVAPQHMSCRVSLANWRPILTFGISMITVSGVAQLSQRASEIILARMLGLTSLGLYSRASNLSSLIFNNLYGTATGVVFVQLSQTYRETGVLRDAFLRGLQMIIAFMWPLLMGVAVLARPAIYIVYGPKWVDAALPLSLLMVAQFVVLSFGMNWELFVLRNETARQAKYEVARSAAGLALFTIGATFSVGAAALGRIGDALLGASLYLPQMSRLSGTSRRELVAIYLQGGTLTLAAVLPSLAVMIANDWRFDTPIGRVAGGVAAGVVLWAIAIKCLDHPLLQEIDMLLARYRGRTGSFRAS